MKWGLRSTATANIHSGFTSLPMKFFFLSLFGFYILRRGRAHARRHCRIAYKYAKGRGIAAFIIPTSGSTVLYAPYMMLLSFPLLPCSTTPLYITTRGVKVRGGGYACTEEAILFRGRWVLSLLSLCSRSIRAIFWTVNKGEREIKGEFVRIMDLPSTSEFTFFLSAIFPPNSDRSFYVTHEQLNGALIVADGFS